MTGKHMFIRHTLAILLIVALILAPMLPGNISISFAAPAYSDSLDGWQVDCVWSDHSYNMEWNSTNDGKYRPTLIFSYYLENAERDYAPGSIKVVIPGIGDSYRKGVKGAYRLPTDSGESEWDVSWDENADVYTFTNRFDVKTGQSVNGGFEIIWELAGREIKNGYTQRRSPKFSVEDAGSITLNPLGFSCTTQRDLYFLHLTRDIQSSGTGTQSDADHLWYGFTATFDKEWLSRGLNLSSCIVTIQTSKTMDAGDIVIKDGNGELIEVFEDSDGKLSFYLFENRSGDLGSSNRTFSKSFTIGLPHGMDGEELTVHVHLDRLYNDETEWVREAGKGEVVDQELTLTVEDYGFVWNGLKYGVDLWNEPYENYGKAPYYYTYEYEDELTHLEPPDYAERLRASDIYNGTEVEFDLRGSSKKDYSPANVALFLATPSDIIMEDDEEYEEIIVLPPGLASPSNALNVSSEDTGSMLNSLSPLSPTSADDLTGSMDEIPAADDADIQTFKIAEGEEYSMVLGDDVLAIYLRDGSIRALEDDEYDITYVNIPKASQSYSYNLYGAAKTDALSEDYELLAVSDMSSARSFLLPDGIKAVYVQIDGISENFAVIIQVGVRLHLDRQKEQVKDEEKRPDHENRIVNFSYFRALCKDKQGSLYNDCVMSESDYGGSFGEALAGHDVRLYGEYLLRDYSNVWLRSAVTALRAGVSVRPFEPGEDVSTSRIEAGGSIKSDSEGALKRFSIYTVLPDGINTDLYSGQVTVTGELTTMNGGKVAYPEDYVSFSQDTYRGRRMITADFDFSGLPLMAEASNEVSISYPIMLSRADRLVYGDSYTFTVYLLPHDEETDKVTGPAIVADTYDIDHNGDTSEKMAYAGTSVEIGKEADEWREYAAKYVKSAFSDGYVKDAVTNRHITSDMALDDGLYDTDSLYEYRLDLGLGASAAENIVFFDHLEQGAKVAVNGDGYENLLSEWQGSFISVDTSYAEKLGLKATVYYSTDVNEAFDLASPGWSERCPEDTSKVKSIAVALDTGGLPEHVMQAGSFVYVIIKMRAPESEELIGKKAVNQYSACYDSYGVTGASEGRFTLPSAATTLTLLNGVGRIILQKVDADDLIRVDANGIPHYAPLTGAAFQIYDSSGNPLFDTPRPLNPQGMLVVDDIPLGTYYWEEIMAPEGYERLEGRHEFMVDDTDRVITVENHRLSEVPEDKDPAILTINKEVNEIYAPFGDPTFIFKVTRSDGAVYFTSITLTLDHTEGSVSLNVEQGYSYTVEEVGVSRYLPGGVEAVRNAETDPENHRAIADLQENDEAEVKFYNEAEQYEKFSHSACVVNSVKGALESAETG